MAGQRPRRIQLAREDARSIGARILADEQPPGGALLQDVAVDGRREQAIGDPRGQAAVEQLRLQRRERDAPQEAVADRAFAQQDGAAELGVVAVLSEPLGAEEIGDADLRQARADRARSPLPLPGSCGPASPPSSRGAPLLRTARTAAAPRRRSRPPRRGPAPTCPAVPASAGEPAAARSASPAYRRQLSVFVPAAFVPLPLVLVLRGEDEKIELHRQRELPAIEEHRGCRLHAGGDAFFLVPVDDGVESPRISLA